MPKIAIVALSAGLLTIGGSAAFAASHSMSKSDMAMMKKCKAMSHSAMEKNKKCMAMMKRHPDMMNDSEMSGSGMKK